MNRLLLLVTILILVIIFILLYFYLKQESMIFYPSKGYSEPPSYLGVEEVFINTTDGEKLHAWWQEGGSTNDTIIFFHGNAGNLSQRVGRVNLFKEMGYNSLMIDYRGYGNSTGKITSEKDIYTDAKNAYDYVLKEKGIPEENIILWGRSLGGAPAIDLAQNKKIKALICESTFYSGTEMAKKLYPYLPIGYFLKYKFKNNKKIKNVNSPVLIMHSSEDEIVPYKQGRNLYKEASRPKNFIEMKGGHNRPDLSKYKSQIMDFLKEI